MFKPLHFIFKKPFIEEQKLGDKYDLTKMFLSSTATDQRNSIDS